MEIQFHGANCVTIATKQNRVTIDDNLEDLGGKSATKEGDIVLFTGSHGQPPKVPRLFVDQPGEYEIAGISVYGIPVRSHLEEGKAKTATMYKVLIDNTSVLVVGHIYPELSDDQLERVGMVDIMLVPVGGNGYTLDPVGALKVIKKIEPKIVIPTHYDSKNLQLTVPQQPLEQALKELSMEPSQTVLKFKPKAEDFADGTTKLVVVEES